MTQVLQLRWDAGGIPDTVIAIPFPLDREIPSDSKSPTVTNTVIFT